MTPNAANQAGQVLGQCDEATLLGPASREPAVLMQEHSHLLDHRFLLIEKGQQSVGRVEAANNHDH
jgi:hypothetical protein